MHRPPPLTRSVRELLTDSIARFSRYTVLVVGDLMLDVFVWGDVRRISPEAPVPVVEVREETRLLGGTANVVHNVAALGAKTMVAGVIGDDFPGRQLIHLFREISVPTEGVVTEPERPTTVKTRILARSQQVVRFDREMPGAMSRGSTQRVLDYIQGNLPRIDGIIVSDYAKGVITQDLMDAIRAMTAGTAIPVVVDPKVQHIGLYRGVSLITPNHHEASRMSGIEITDDSSLAAAGRELLDRLQCQTVLITRGKDGMTLFHRNGQVVHIPTVARRVFDVTGAGDTVLATITLGVVSGLSVEESALMANLAAGIVVGEVGTAVVSADRLTASIQEGC